MNQEIKEYILKYPKEIIELFNVLHSLINNCIEVEVIEKMWAKLPSYCVNDSFIRLIPFKDHINIEAKAMINYQKELSNYKITPKGMLQLFINQEVPCDILKKVFTDTLKK